MRSFFYLIHFHNHPTLTFLFYGICSTDFQDFGDCIHMSTEERSKWRIINVADVIRCEQHRLKFPKIHLIKILKLPPGGQWVCDKSRDKKTWVCDKSRDKNLFTTTPPPPYLFYGICSTDFEDCIHLSTEERSKGRINIRQNMYLPTR